MCPSLSYASMEFFQITDIDTFTSRRVLLTWLVVMKRFLLTMEIIKLSSSTVSCIDTKIFLCYRVLHYCPCFSL